MTFIDWIRIDEVSLGSRITLAADDGDNVTGRVIALKLLGDGRHRVTLKHGDSNLVLDRKPSDQAALDW